jgi:hypothetical protein
MGEPLRKIASSRDHAVWMTQPDESEFLMKRRDIAFDVAKGKLAESGNIETAMQTAEAFGRGLFSDFIKNESTAWTMNTLIEPMTEHILNPMGTGATFTNITENEATSLIFRCRLHDEVDEPHMASLFTYGFLRGMLRSAFPHGELLMGSSMAEGAPMIELTFKTRATDKDRWERERIKRLMIDAAKPEE